MSDNPGNTGDIRQGLARVQSLWKFSRMGFDLSKEELYPLQIILRDILIQSQMDMNMVDDMKTMAAKQAMRELMKYALIVVASVPVLIIYPFVQKYFVRGIMLGAIKG